MTFFKKSFNIFVFSLFIQNFTILHSSQLFVETARTIDSSKDPEVRKDAYPTPNDNDKNNNKVAAKIVRSAVAAGTLHVVGNAVKNRNSSITQDKRKMLKHYNFNNYEYDNMVADIKATYGDGPLSDSIIQEICELNKFAKNLSDKITTEHSKYKYRTHHVFNIDNARKDHWNGLHYLHYQDFHKFTEDLI